MSRRIAVLGAGGLLGSAFAEVAATDPRVSAVIPVPSSQADVTRPAEVAELLRREQPDVVVNAAVFNGADQCDAEPWRAYQVNTLGARHVARACADIGARCVYVSSDFVFDGNSGRPYDETDPPRPLLTYGVSKLAGELETLSIEPENVVIRTAALFGPRPHSPRARLGFVHRILDRAAAGQSSPVVDTISMSPTYTVDLSRMMLEMLADEVDGGTYHVVNNGSATWHDLAHAAVSAAGLQATPTRAATGGRFAVARRPRSTPLSSVRLPESVRRLNRPWREAMADFASAHLRSVVPSAVPDPLQ